MNKKTKWGLVAFLICGLTGWGIYSRMPKENAELKVAGSAKDERKGAKGNKALNVNAVVIRKGKLTDAIRVTGLLLPDEEVDLSFETSGQVVAINFKEGGHVSKGQLLAKVNDRQLQAQLKRLTAQLKLAENRVFRQQTLLKKDAVSQEAYEQVRTELETLKAEIDIIRAQIELTELRAPFDGVIGLRQISVGAYATSATKVAKLARVVPLKVEFSVPERYASQVNVGTGLDFTLDGKLQPYSATVYAKEAAIDVETHTLTVRAIYPNPGGRLTPGRYTSVTLKKEEVDGAIAVPAEAIVPEMGKDKVFVCRGGKARPVEIVTGIRTESQVQVLRGLSVGDTLIVSGTLQLRTDLPVVLDRID
ncbi:MAG: efflux RND transporter periplasmic adaptor subunit [Clostridium sp.]|nr:efflux RND transporter periplasmic adaptor subunit [Clostridium sp.]